MSLLQSAGPGMVSTSTPKVVADAALASTEGNGAPIAMSANDQISLYIVHAGDTLGGIAQMFGVSVNTIVWANNLKSRTVSPGQELVILPISGISYIVKSGDTLNSIAKKYGGDATEIAQFNDLADNSSLKVGTTIIIPDGEMSGVSQTSAESQKPSSSSNSGSASVESDVPIAGMVAIEGGGTSPLASGAFPAPAGAPPVGAKGPNYPVIVGYYERPITGGVKTQGIHGHNAVDLAGAYGQSIFAAADGTVIVAKAGGWNGGYGSYVVISHANGTQTLYAHLSHVGVQVGDQVTQGETIGRMGETGDATGIHVHFEIRGAPNPF